MNCSLHFSACKAAALFCLGVICAMYNGYFAVFIFFIADTLNKICTQACYVEPALKDAKPYDSFQFVRQGFFNVDAKDSKPDALVFNRIVSLKSSFVLPK